MSASATLLQSPNPAIKPGTCFHCHEVCPPEALGEHLRIGTRQFCCNGCKMVYEILSTNDLCDFYTLDDQAGRPLRNQRSANAYAYLDDAEVKEKLLEFDNGQMAQVTFYLPQMHCISCIWLLEHLCKLDAGTTHSRVNFLKKTVTIQFDPTQTTLRKLAALLASIGYAPEINLGDIEGKKAPGITRKLAYQLGIAGFAVGNIMLFSFPEYVGMSLDDEPWFASVFGYLSIALALPVLLFSARDYFISAWQGIRNRQLNIDIPLCLALASLFGRSVWEILTHSGAGYLDSFAGLTFLLLIGRWFQQRTWHQLSFERDYKSYFPVAATLKDADGERAVPIQRLVPGDIIVVRSHEIIPADGILLRGSAQVDYSFVTGEAEPVTVQQGERIYAGGKQTGGSIEVSLTRRVAQSHLTQLWNNEAFQTGRSEDLRGSVSSLADQAGRVFSWLILGVGGSAFLYWWLLRGDVGTGLNAFTAVMIVACPCTVALSIPFTLGNILRILGRYGFYLKNSRVVEQFAHITAVVFDKTGTITNATQREIRWLPYHDTAPAHLTFEQKVAIRSLVHHSAHPLSRRISESLPDVPTEQPTEFREIPGAGLRARLRGQEIAIGSGEFVGIPQAGPGVYVSIAGQMLGHFEVKNRYRDGLMGVLEFFSRTGTPTYLISGDQDHERKALAPFFPDAAMHFQQSPQEKLDFVQNLQQDGEKVLMLGDGLNDAGALRQSDLGIVVAEDTNNFTPACDAILRAEEFERLPQLVALARSGRRIVLWSYAVALAYNAVGLSYAVTGALSPLIAAILMPASSISIVLFGVSMGNLAAKRAGLR